MRRAPLQLLRPAIRRSFQYRRTSRTRSSLLSNFFGPHHAITSQGVRSFASRRASFTYSIPASSVGSPFMRYRLSASIVAAIVAGGAWYYNAAHNPLRADSGRGSLTNSNSPLASATAEAAITRKALVVEDGQIFSGTISGNGPLSKDTDDYGRKVLEMLTPEQATEKLRQNEESWFVGRGKGVIRYDVVQIPSNNPIEDDHAEKIIQVPDNIAATADGATNSDWMFWGVYDGHSGWTTSAKLRQTLISYVARELNNTYMEALKDAALKLPNPDAIDAAMKAGFVNLDNEIVHKAVSMVNEAKSKRVAAEALAPALSGSCALLSFYDSSSKTLRVACTGDSRAVLGRRTETGKWKAIPLSVDQTGSNEEEAARLRKEHPNEPDVVRHGRVLGGLEPTRAFGDAVYKWSMETMEQLRQSYFVRSGSSQRRTPPYVTAEPVVTRTKIQPENGDFVVMATDGLWEMLSNEEVIGLVGQWMEIHGSKKNSSSTLSSSWLNSWLSQHQKGLPVEKPTDTTYGKQPIRQQQWKMEDNPNRYVYDDKNVATHLVRNALGGKDNEQVCALLTLTSPYARRYRDDLTVSVIFFGDEAGNGDVSLNEEASAAAKAPKPKL